MENKEKIEQLRKKAASLSKKLDNTERADFAEIARELRNTENLIHRLENPIDHGNYQGIGIHTVYKENTTFTTKHN